MDDQKELAKIAAESALKPFANLIEKLFGGAAEQVGGMWTDSFSARRHFRRIKIFEKLKQKIENAGFGPTAIPDRLWLPALQEASLEDDETLQEKWANLLANAADPAEKVPVLPIFPTILKELRAGDARLLDTIYRHAVRAVSDEKLAEHPTSIEFSNESLVSLFSEAGLAVIANLHQTPAGKQMISPEAIAADERTFGLSMDVLTRNRLIEENFRTQILVNDKHVGAGNVFSLTDIGVAFVRACTAPETPSP